MTPRLPMVVRSSRLSNYMQEAKRISPESVQANTSGAKLFLKDGLACEPNKLGASAATKA